MSSAFNLSTLVAMQDQRVERASVHFWRCQLTSEKPRFAWNPDAKAPTGEVTTNGDKDKNKNDSENAPEEAEDSDITTRHVLHVTGCVLGPKAEGIHLVTVRTRRYEKQQPQQSPATEPEACPILCVDPAAQRTLALGHEFVLEHAPTTGAAQQPSSSSTCVFELAEGSGPVWLTGTHRVHRVVPETGAGDFEEEEEDEEEESENDEEEEAGAEDEEEDIAEESEEEEEDDDEELIEEVKPVKKGRGRQKAAAAKPKPKPQKAAATAAAGNGKQQRKRAQPDS